MATNGFVWFWKDDTGWTPYSDVHQDAIETARIRGEDHVILQIGGSQAPYLLDFGDEVQENLELGHRRLVSKANEYSVWYWKDDDGVTWNMYDQEHAEILTRAEAENEPEVYLVINEVLYRIDLPRRLQMNFDNQNTGNSSREVRQGRRAIQRQADTTSNQSNNNNSSSNQGGGDGRLDDIPIDPDMEPIAPPSYLCPISFHIMDDPVTTSAGSTYDRKAIQWWLNDHDTDPLTKRPIQDKLLVPNNALKQTIEDWKKEYRSKLKSEAESAQTKPLSVRKDDFCNQTLKVVFLGQNKMGTSSIVQKLVHGKDANNITTNGGNQNSSSTSPGLQICDWRPTPELQFHLLDFRGQASLHSYRSIGFSPQALFVIVWDLGVSNISASFHQDSDKKTLKQDIQDKVQYWVDRINERVSNAVILLVASYSDKFQPINGRRFSQVDHSVATEKDAQQRCQFLKETLVSGSATILYGDDEDDPVVRVSGYSSAGIDKLQARILEIAPQQQIIVSAAVGGHREIRQTIISMKQTGYKMVDLDELERALKEAAISADDMDQALSWLVNVGEILNFPSLPSPFDKVIILDQSWFFRLCGCILRPNWKVAVRDGRRREDRGCAPSFGGAVSENCPAISKEDASMLWLNHLGTTDFSQSLSAKSFTSTDVLDFVQTLMVHMGVLVPVDEDVGPLSSQKLYAPDFEAQTPRYIPPHIAQTPGASYLSASLLCIPSLLIKGDHDNGLNDVSFVSGSSTGLAHQVQFQDKAPDCFMEEVTVALLRNITMRLKENEETGNEGVLALERVHCWRSVFLVRFSWNRSNERGETQRATVEVCSQLVDSAAWQKNGGVNGAGDRTQGIEGYMFTSATVVKGGGGQNIWEGGYGLVLETIHAVIGGHQGLNFATSVFCPSCLASKGIHGSHFWDLEDVDQALKESGKQLKCRSGHLVSPDLLTGTGSVVDVQPTNELEPSLKQAVVLVGLYDARERSNKIQRLGSGVIVDVSRGLIVTAARNLMKIEGQAQFGQNYCGILGGKVVIGVMPSEDSDEAVFRYYARIVAKDPALEDSKVCHVDACILKITSRFEEDVEGNGDGCCEEIELLLRDNPAKIAAQHLVQLPTQTRSNLEDRVSVLGYEQSNDYSTVNRRLNDVSGYICQKKSATASPEDRFTFQPLKTTVVMADAKPGHFGGPCVNRQGEIVGILSSGDPDEDSRSFVVPVSEWADLVANASP